MDTQIKSATEELSISVQSDGPGFGGYEARSAAAAYLLQEYPGENWEHRDTDLVNYDEYAVRYRRVRNEAGKRGPSWGGLGEREATGAETETEQDTQKGLAR